MSKQIVISDLLTLIHYTIIQHDGVNDVVLRELESIEHKIKSGQLKDYDVSTTTFWKNIESKL